jgi:AraC-like DNA-binding protein
MTALAKYLTFSATRHLVAGVNVVSCELLLGDSRLVRFDRVPRNNVHRHNYFEPCYVVSGTGEFVHEEEHLALRPGDLFIANPGSFHEITSLKTKDLSLWYTSFSIAEKAQRALASSMEETIIQCFLNEHRIKAGQQQHIGRCFQSFSRLEKGMRLAQSAYFTEQLKKVLVLQIMAALAPIEESTVSGHPAWERIRRVIELHPTLTVPEIAKMSGVSERSMRRLFHDKLGRTVTSEIQKRRIGRAATLLALPELSIAEVGQRIGIDDPGQFTRLFKKVMGMTPRDFRQQKLPQSPETWRWVTVGNVSMRTEFL